jgi:guanyl-specific ribonuclease Sa
MKSRIFFMTVLCVCLCAGLRAQDTVQNPQPSNAAPAAVETQTAPAAAVAEKKPAEAVKPAPAAQPKAAAVPAAVVPAETDSLTLQDMADGDFRYARIQGMTFEKKKILTAGEQAKAGPDAGDKESSSGKNGWVVKGVLLLIFFLVFLLYRYGRKGRRRKVLRRFPK